MKPASLALSIAAVIVLVAVMVSAQDAPHTVLDKAKVKYSPYPEEHFPNQVFFGDTHSHTSYSSDAGVVSCPLAGTSTSASKRADTSTIWYTPESPCTYETHDSRAAPAFSAHWRRVVYGDLCLSAQQWRSEETDRHLRREDQHLAALFARTVAMPGRRERTRGAHQRLHSWRKAAYREGLALGLERDYTIIRLAHPPEARLHRGENIASQVEPTEADLLAYLAAHPEDFLYPCAALAFQPGVCQCRAASQR